jgi:hypothetical protein
MSQNNIKDNKKYSQLSVLILRAGKMVSGVYLVTDIMSDMEPLKWKLRDSALSLMSFLNKGHDNSVSNSGVLDRISDLIAEIISMLDVGLIGGVISDMNHAVLKNEYVSMGRLLVQSGAVARSSRFILPGRFINGDKFLSDKHVGLEVGVKDIERRLDIAEKNIVQKNYAENTQKVYKGHSVKDNKDNVLEKSVVSYTNSGTGNIPTKENDLENQTPDKNQMSFISDESQKVVFSGQVKNSRKELILNSLKDGGGKTIKDICLSLGPVGRSEKTIQRDLIDLVISGDIKKVGERRWSRYFLVAKTAALPESDVNGLNGQLTVDQVQNQPTSL